MPKDHLPWKLFNFGKKTKQTQNFHKLLNKKSNGSVTENSWCFVTLKKLTALPSQLL